MPVSKKHSALENPRSLQAASWNNDGTTQMYGCKCSFEITIPLKKISVKYIVYMKFMVASTIKEWLAATNFVK